MLDEFEVKINEETDSLKQKKVFILTIMNEIGNALDKNFVKIKDFDYEVNIENFINLFNYFDSLCDKKRKSLAIYFI